MESLIEASICRGIEAKTTSLEAQDCFLSHTLSDVGIDYLSGAFSGEKKFWFWPVFAARPHQTSLTLSSRFEQTWAQIKEGGLRAFSKLWVGDGSVHMSHIMTFHILKVFRQILNSNDKTTKATFYKCSKSWIHAKFDEKLRGAGLLFGQISMSSTSRVFSSFACWQTHL